MDPFSMPPPPCFKQKRNQLPKSEKPLSFKLGLSPKSGNVLVVMRAVRVFHLTLYIHIHFTIYLTLSHHEQHVPFKAFPIPLPLQLKITELPLSCCQICIVIFVTYSPTNPFCETLKKNNGLCLPCVPPLCGLMLLGIQNLLTFAMLIKFYK